jgi:hypothetical protein
MQSLLGEQVERLNGLFGEADDSCRRKHRTPRMGYSVGDFSRSRGGVAHKLGLN